MSWQWLNTVNRVNTQVKKVSVFLNASSRLKSPKPPAVAKDCAG